MRENDEKWRAAGGADGLGVHLVFDVQDHTEKGLEKIEHSMEAIEHAHEGLKESAEHATHSVISLQGAFEHMQHTGHQVMELGERGMEMFEGMAHHAIEAASEFDALHAKMQFAFGEETDRAFRNLRTFEQNSAYSMAELTESVAALRSAFREIDPTDLTPRFRSATGQMESGLEALSDAAAGAGVSLGDTIQIVERALEGNYQSIAYQMRLSGTEVTAMKTRIQAARTEQEKYNAIVETLATHWGGAQRTMGGTFNMLETRLKSITHLIWAEIGEKGLEPIKELMDELHGMFRRILGDREFVELLAESFRRVTVVVRNLGRYFIELVDAFREWAKENPAVVRFLVTLWAVGSGLLVVIGKVIALGASVGMAGLAMQTLGVTLGGVLLAFGKALLIIVAVGAALSTLWSAAKRVWERDFMGIRTFLERVGWTLRGLYEAFQHWGDSTTEISEETARGLHQSGILDWFLQVVGWASRAQKWIMGVWKALQDGWEEASPALMRAWDDLSTAFQQAWDSIKRALVDAGFLQDAVQTSFKDSGSSGNRFGQILTTIVVPAIKMFAEGMKFAAWWIRNVVIPAWVALIKWWGKLKEFFSSADGQALMAALRTVVNIIGHNLRAAFTAAKVVAYLLMGAIRLLAYYFDKTLIEPVQDVIEAFKDLYNWLVDLDNWLFEGRLMRSLSAIGDVLKTIGKAMSPILLLTGLFSEEGEEPSGVNRITGGGTERLTPEEEQSEVRDRRTPRGRSFAEYAGTNDEDRDKVLLTDQQVREGKSRSEEESDRLLQSITEMTTHVKRLNSSLEKGQTKSVVTDEQIAAAAMNGYTDRAARFGRMGRE